MRVSTLIENSSVDLKLGFEHGLSLFVETEGFSFLIDTGAGGGFIANAQQMKVDLKAVEACVVSHNHTDHTGGIERLLEYNKDVKLYCRKEMQRLFYAKALFLKVLISETPDFFERNKDRIIFSYDKFPLAQNVYLCSVDKPDKEFLCPSKNLYMKVDGKFKRDDYGHEQYVVVVEGDKLNIISPCSHMGIINILNDAQSKFPSYSLNSFVGGLHLKKPIGIYNMNCSIPYLNAILARIKEMGLKSIYTGHCTGLKAYELIEMQMGENLRYIKGGSVYDI